MKSYVGPANEIAPPILQILKRWVLHHPVGEINVQSIFKQGETGVNRAVVSSKFRVRRKVEDLSLYPVLGLLRNGVDVIGTGLVEPALAIRFCVLM